MAGLDLWPVAMVFGVNAFIAIAIAINVAAWALSRVRKRHPD